jgi:beta-glucosidase
MSTIPLPDIYKFSCRLPGLTNRLVSDILHANPNTVVVNQSGTPVTMPWIAEADTVIHVRSLIGLWSSALKTVFLQAFYGGNELGNGLADVLFGKVNPSGKLALTFP